MSSSDDVSKRLLATFLTWLAENKTSVFVVATANDVSALPPELMRKGRFDEVFFVDLPNPEVREQILRLHLDRRDLQTESWDLSELVKITEGFSGAELEQLVVSAIFEAAAARKQKIEVSPQVLIRLAEATQPLSILMREKVVALQNWATERTVAA